MNKKIAIVITGPTASGKSALAVSLAKELNTEIISADSRQVYRGIPIVTAVPSIEERGGIPHHLLECLNLDEYYSAARFEEDASKIMGEVFKERDYIVVCGGSMLYTDALIDGIDLLPTVPPDIREGLMNEWKEKGDEWLLNQLEILDPVYYQKIDHRNLKRVFHAVEISLVASKPYTSLLTGKSGNEPGKSKNSEYEFIKVCLEGERELLFDRINQRVLKMVDDGLEEEARSVYHLRHLNSLNTVGLKEMFTLFDGKFSRAEAIARIQKNTRVYAKKQLTWHKRDEKRVTLDFAASPEYNTEKILLLLRTYKS